MGRKIKFSPLEKLLGKIMADSLMIGEISYPELLKKPKNNPKPRKTKRGT